MGLNATQEGTKEFRLKWWTHSYNYTSSREYFWIDPGVLSLGMPYPT